MTGPHYVEPLYRPPSEARSLILQVTNGCSWNRCTFCEMYTDPHKRFRLKGQDDIDRELRAVAAENVPIRRIFLADGDAMNLSFRRLRSILESIERHLPGVQRVASYCLPRNLQNKTVKELAELAAMKLNLFYVGCESGDDLVLERVSKGETYASSLAALEKIRAAGARSSVMILNGMGGKRYSRQHAVNSARLMSAAQPEYLSTLVVSFPKGMERYSQSGGLCGSDLPALIAQLAASIIALGSVLTNSFRPYLSVIGLSVFSRKVKQRTPSTVASSCMPPESVIISDEPVSKAINSA